MQVVNIVFSAVKSMQKILADDICVCITTAVDISVQVQMNQRKIVWSFIRSCIVFSQSKSSSVRGDIKVTMDIKGRYQEKERTMPISDKSIAQQWANILKRMTYYELGHYRANMLEQYWADEQTGAGLNIESQNI